MAGDLKDKGLFVRFFSVSVIGTIADFILSVLLASVIGLPHLFATTCGFILGSIVNYCGHSIFSYEHTSRDTLSVKGYAKYFVAILGTLAVRLGVVAILSYLAIFPFWFILLCAIGVSFIASYVISTLWVFKKPD